VQHFKSATTDITVLLITDVKNEFYKL